MKNVNIKDDLLTIIIDGRGSLFGHVHIAHEDMTTSIA
jgi:hypothetical protein